VATLPGSATITSRPVAGHAAAFAATALLILGIVAVFTYGAPSIWLWVVPLSGAKTSRAAMLGRSLVGAVLLLQYLHAYPVGGSQVSWATFLFVPLVALGLEEIRQCWTARVGDSDPSPRYWTPLAAGLLLIAIVKAATAGVAMRDRHTRHLPLGLPGTANLRLAATQATAYRILVLNAAVHADMLFSLPGMFSLNVWTGLPTATSRNTTLWFTLLNAQEQADIIAALTEDERPVVIVQESPARSGARSAPARRVTISRYRAAGAASVPRQCSRTCWSPSRSSCSRSWGWAGRWPHDWN
jgi:hypothetical protein